MNSNAFSGPPCEPPMFKATHPILGTRDMLRAMVLHAAA